MLRAIVGAAYIAGAASNGGAQSTAESDAYAWVQYAADGRAHVRVIPSDRAACPEVTGDGFGTATMLAVPAGAGFDRILCDAALPPLARDIRVGVFALPPVPGRIGRFVVLGDTGCRITAAQIQDCRDNRAWPFARIARAIAAEVPRPDLIVHLGGYVDRDAPCPAGDARCAGSPYGDTWPTWAVDFFEPGAPLLATAPILWLRGGHEECAHAGLGWSRYLAPDPQETCTPRDAPLTVSFADLRLVVAGSPPTVLLRTGGEADDGAGTDLRAAFGDVVERRLGYAVFDRLPGGWSISERDPDGTEHRRCQLAADAVHC